MEISDRHTDFEYIYIYYFPKMKRFAREYVLSDEDAENIVQDVFLELWEKKEILSLQLNVIAYLFTAIRNRCINFLRRSMIAKNAENKLQEEYKLTLQMKYYSLEAFNQEIFQEKDVEQILSKAIDTLPEKCREIFILSKIKGKKQKDIATELNISVNTVETQISIAYKKLRNELKEHFPLFYFLLCLCNDIT